MYHAGRWYLHCRSLPSPALITILTLLCPGMGICLSSFCLFHETALQPRVKRIATLILREISNGAKKSIFFTIIRNKTKNFQYLKKTYVYIENSNNSSYQDIRPWRIRGLHGTQKPAHDLSEKRSLRFIRNRSWKQDQHFTARGTIGEICPGTCFHSTPVSQCSARDTFSEFPKQRMIYRFYQHWHRQEWDGVIPITPDVTCYPVRLYRRLYCRVPSHTTRWTSCPELNARIGGCPILDSSRGRLHKHGLQCISPANPCTGREIIPYRGNSRPLLPYTLFNTGNPPVAQQFPHAVSDSRIPVECQLWHVPVMEPS